MADNKAIGATAIKPEKKEGFAGCMEFLYNKKDGTVMGRTGKSWGLILLFYIIYYACLAGFWALMLFVFFQVRDTTNTPVYMGTDGLIGNEPGLGIRPTQSEKNIGNSVIYLYTKKKLESGIKRNVKDNSNLGYASRLEEFFLKYTGDECKCKEEDRDCKKKCKSKRAVECEGTKTNKDVYDKVGQKFCNFNTTTLDDCENWPYGYGNDLKPCVFLKLNRIFNFMPTDYAGKETIQKGKEKVAKNGPYVKCEGEFPADKDYVTNKTVTYFPSEQTFPIKYFPMMSKEQDQSPLVALQFSKLPVGRMIQVICKAYYGEIEHSKKTKKGLVQFQLFVVE